jgi:MoxR-like ATPase
MEQWYVYQGTTEPHNGIETLPPPPPWRTFGGTPFSAGPSDKFSAVDRRRATTYRPDPEVLRQVNAALYLRRPLLVTGAPGNGKSSLAYAVAHELGLGRVLKWPINSRTTLTQGLYSYDPISRLYEASNDEPPDKGDDNLSRHLRLGPLGTAMAPYRKPRVLLIDEIDKGDPDLPNDLLTVFEDGEYEIPELVRAPRDQYLIQDAEGNEARVPVLRGRVQTMAFPFVVMTSNGERPFPSAFLRRCITLEIAPPSAERLKDIVDAHLGDTVPAREEIIEQFLSRRGQGDVATDQLLNAVYITRFVRAEERGEIAGAIMAYISEADGGAEDR